MAKEVKAAIVLGSQEEEFEKIREIENGLHLQAASIVQAAMRAPDINPEDENCPESWYQQFGSIEQAKRAFRIACAAWKSNKDAPAFLKLSQDFLAGSMKARSKEDKGPRVLNATIVTTTAPAPVFPERIVTHDDDD